MKCCCCCCWGRGSALAAEIYILIAECIAHAILPLSSARATRSSNKARRMLRSVFFFFLCRPSFLVFPYSPRGAGKKNSSHLQILRLFIRDAGGLITRAECVRVPVYKPGRDKRGLHWYYIRYCSPAALLIKVLIKAAKRCALTR